MLLLKKIKDVKILRSKWLVFNILISLFLLVIVTNAFANSFEVSSIQVDTRSVLDNNCAVGQSEPPFKCDPGEKIYFRVYIKNVGSVSAKAYVGGAIDGYPSGGNYCNLPWISSGTIYPGSTDYVLFSWTIPSNAGGLYGFTASTWGSCWSGCEGSPCYKDGCCATRQSTKSVSDLFTVSQPTGTIIIEPREYLNSSQKLPTDEMNAVILYDENYKEVARKQPPSSNPMSFSNIPYGNYIVEVYCWDMLVGSSGPFSHSSSTTYRYPVADFPKRPLSVQVYYNDGSTLYPGASVYLYSWNGEKNYWTQRANNKTDNNGKVIFQAWPTTLSEEKYKVEVFNNDSKLVGSKDNVKVDKTIGGSEGIPTTQPIPREATIIEFIPPAGTLQRGTQAQTTVRIKNTGSTTRSFWVGLSFAHETATGDGWPEGWYDIRPIQSNILAPNEEQQITFQISVAETWRSGQFYAVSRIWDKFNEELYRMEGPIDSTLWHPAEHPEWVTNPDIGMKTFSLAPFVLSNEIWDAINQLGYITEIVEGLDLYDLYIANGKKPLLYVGSNKNFTISHIPVSVGGAIFIDLADLLKITPEGKEGWSTIWIASQLGGVGFSYDLTKKMSSVGVGIIFHDFDYSQRGIADYRPSPLEFGKITTPIISISIMSYDIDGFDFFNYEWSGTNKLGLWVEQANNILYKKEIRSDIIIAALRLSPLELATGYISSVDYGDKVIDVITLLGSSPNIFRDFTYDDGYWPVEQGQPQSNLKMRVVDAKGKESGMGYWPQSAHKFYIDIPANVSNLNFSTSGGTGGGIAMLICYEQEISNDEFSCKDETLPLSDYNLNGTSISISQSSPPTGRYYIALPVAGYSDATYEGVRFVATYDNEPLPQITVTPSTFDFGSVEVGTFVDKIFTVENASYGTLSGNATVSSSSPFTIVSGGSYNLLHGQTQTVTVRFSPMSVGTFNENVTFTGGGGAVASVTGKGVDVIIAPIISPISNQSTPEGSSYIGPIPTLTQGTQPVIWALVTAPSGMSIDHRTGVVSWPNPTVSGSPHTITIRATNTAGSDEESWHLTVTPVQYKLTTSVTPFGAGRVEPDCSGGCWYDSGTSVTLTATANSGYTFKEWGGCDNPSRNTCTMTMNADKTVTANYTTATSACADSFEDGIINTNLWEVGGRAIDAFGGGAWNYENVEVVDTIDGYLSNHVWGTVSGLTYGAEAWVRTKYDFNDGQQHTINFTWEPTFADYDYHTNIFYIQITDGYIATNQDLFWQQSDYPGTSDLLWDSNSTGKGWGFENEPSPGKLNWSITIDPSGIARLYDGPNATGNLLRQENLDSTYPWYIRFMVSDGTSSGFPAGDARLNLYNFSVSGNFFCERNLSTGWNLISLYKQPSNTDIASVLSSIAGKYTIVWAYINGSWKAYVPAYPGFSDLTTMEAGKGYWINMTEAETLIVTGSTPSTSIPLVSGWNLVGYNSSTSRSVADALNSIAGKYISVWAFVNGGWKVYNPANPGSSTLTTMEPGYGYWINMKEATTWTLP